MTRKKAKHHKPASRAYTNPAPVIAHSQLSLRIPSTLNAAIRQYAVEHNVSVNSVINEVLAEAF